MPFQIVKQFEQVIADYAGSKYAVAVDSCSHALFLSLLYCNVKNKTVTIPSHTYPSVPCYIIHAGAKVAFENVNWKGIYQLKPFPIIDGAKRFTKNMYEQNTFENAFHCLSFHSKKHLKIGRGGMILTNSPQACQWFKMARFDGRHECTLQNDNFNILGWNFYMTPEQAARGLWLMSSMPNINEDLVEIPNYPDLSTFPIYQNS